MKAAEDAEGRLVNWLKESMVGSISLEGDGFSVSWKPHDRTTVTHKTVAEVYRHALEELGTDPAELDTLAGLYTTTESVRPFRVHWKGE
jgi:hypothetical protein